MLDADQIRLIVLDEIGDSWDETNAHGVDLREALVPPSLIKLIDRDFKEGKFRDTIIEAWLVLIEDVESGEGYRIVARTDGSSFGLASEGLRNDKHLVLVGWYGDFMDAFQSM